MEFLLAVLGWTSFGLAILAGLVLSALGLFGNWIILAAVALAWLATGREHFALWALGVMLGLAVLGEILEAAAAGFGAKRFGGSKGTMVAAVAGAILGAVAGGSLIVIPVIGIVVGPLIGALAGAFLAAALYEYVQREQKVYDAAWTGFGAALGKVAGMFAKLLCGFAMLIAAAVSF